MSTDLVHSRLPWVMSVLREEGQECVGSDMLKKATLIHPPLLPPLYVLHVTVDFTNHHAPPVRGIDPALSGRCTLVAVKDLLARGGGEVGEVPQVVAVPFALAQLAVNVSQDFISGNKNVSEPEYQFCALNCIH